MNFRDRISRAYRIIKLYGLEILNSIITNVSEKSVGGKFREIILCLKQIKKSFHLICKLTVFSDLAKFYFPVRVFFGGFELLNLNGSFRF